MLKALITLHVFRDALCQKTQDILRWVTFKLNFHQEIHTCLRHKLHNL